jgi:PAS domain S-box-containing protein
MINNSKVNRIFILFIISVFCLHIISKYIFYFGIAKQEALSQSNSFFFDKEKILNDFLDNKKKKLNALNDLFDYNEENLTKIKDYFELLIKIDKFIMQIRFLDQSGKEVIRIDREKLGLYPYFINDKNLQDKYHRDYFIQAKSLEKSEIFFSSIDLNIENGKIEKPFNPTLRAVLPLYNLNRFYGLFIINTYIEDFIEQSFENDIYDVILVDNDGYILTNTYSNDRFTKFSTNKNKIDKYFKEYKNIYKNNLYIGNNFASKKLDLDIANDLYMVITPKQEFIDESNIKAFKETLLIAFIIMFFTVIFFIFLLRIISKLKLDLLSSNSIVDELKITQDKLKETYSMFEDSNIVFFKWSSDNSRKVLNVTTNVKDIFGYTKNDFVFYKLKYQDLIHEDDRYIVEEEMNNSISNRLTTFNQKPYRILSKYGTVRYVHDTTHIKRDEDGNIKYFVGYILDITEEVYTKKKLMNLENRFNLALVSTKDGLWDWDLYTDEVFLSSRWKAMLGYEDSEIEDSLNSWKKLVHPDDIENAWKDIEKHLNKESSFYENEHRLLCKDGSYLWILDRGKAIFDEEGNAIRMIGFHTDISRQRELQESLQDLNKNLENKVEEQLSKLRRSEQLLIEQSKLASMGEMIGSIAHQWRQPLNTLSLRKEMLISDYEDNRLTDEIVAQYSENVDNTLQYMSRTINDFRNFFMPSKEKVRFNIFEVIKSVNSIISAQLKANEIKLVIENKNSEDIFIYGYPNEFKQVIINLINNSKDAILLNKIKNGRIDIKIKEPKEFILNILVCDNGGGIKEDIIFKVFEPYFTTKFKSQGTGIGLYMSKTIIEKNMDGELTVNNTENGACFKISFDLELNKDIENKKKD